MSSLTSKECIRCKRHIAIFSAPWPNRYPALEAFSSDSSESSTPETMIEFIRKKLKGVGYVREPKISRKYVDPKHPGVERPVKRRKTDFPVVFSPTKKSLFQHVDDQLLTDNGRFDRTNNLSKHGEYSHRTFIIPGGAHRSRAHRALRREKVKNLGSVTAPLGTKRRWGHGFQDPEQRALDRIRSRKRPWENDNNSLPTVSNAFPSFTSSQRIIRRAPFLPTLPIAKPLAALCARPTPNMFARNAWATCPYKESDHTHRSIETDSELTDLPEPEPKLAPKVGQKRKHEPAPSEARVKGKEFIMKDGKKPMPKGWVLVTDSSEETCGDEEDRGDSRDKDLRGGMLQPGSSENLQTSVTEPDTTLQRGRSPFYLSMGTDSAYASTPSLAHTPSSRATSTPTQSSGTLVEDQVATSTAGKHVITYSLRRSTTRRTPSTLLTKQKKLKIDRNTDASRSKSDEVSVDAYSGRDTTSERARQLQAEGLQNQKSPFIEKVSGHTTPNMSSAALDGDSGVWGLDTGDISNVKVRSAFALVLCCG